MKSENENVVHVALAVYDPKGVYSRHAGVVMASIFDNTKSPVCVHILHDQTLTDHNRSLLIETAESFGQNVAFHDVSAYIMEQLEDENNRAVRKGVWSIGTLFRLAVPDVLSLDKVIYLDCDVVVNMDIRELWDISVDGYSCAGVPDIPRGLFSSTVFRMKLMGCDTEKYVNAGVLLMNLSRMKEKYDIRQAFLWFRRYWHCAKYQDQDMINSFFRGDIKILEGRYNNFNANLNTSFCGDAHAEGVVDSILHATVTKPWVEPKGSAVDILYWRTFLKTPWGRLSPEELVDMMIGLVQKSPITHRRTAQCYGNILHRLRKDILYNDIVIILLVLIKDLYYRMKRALAG